MLFFHSRSGLRPAYGECRWDAPTSELGLENPVNAGSSEPAEPAAGGHSGPDSSDHDDDGQDADTDDTIVEGRADADDDDEDQTEIDLLTSEDRRDAADRPIEERYKGLSKRARKLEKQVKRSAPLMAALREAGVDLRTLLQRHTKLSQLEADPRVLRALADRDVDDRERRPANAGRRDARRPEGRDVEDDDSPVDYPFDTNDDVGRFISGFHKETRGTQRQILDRLESLELGLDQRVGNIERSTTSERVAHVQTTWKSAVDAASSKIDKPYRQMFSDAMHAAMTQVLNGQLRATPDQIIAHYLKGLGLDKGQRARAQGAAQQRIAESNRTLPRRQGFGRGTPASPASRRVPRLAEFNISLQRKFGAA
jgi:hypothetical protein